MVKVTSNCEHSSNVTPRGNQELSQLHCPPAVATQFLNDGATCKRLKTDRNFSLTSNPSILQTYPKLVGETKPFWKRNTPGEQPQTKACIRFDCATLRWSVHLLQFEKVNFSLICCVVATTRNPREEFRLEYAKSKNIWPNFIWFENIWVNKSTELFGAILKTSIKNRLNEEAIVTFYTLSTLYFSVLLWEL